MHASHVVMGVMSRRASQGHPRASPRRVALGGAGMLACVLPGRVANGPPRIARLIIRAPAEYGYSGVRLIFCALLRSFMFFYAKKPAGIFLRERHRATESAQPIQSR